MAEVEKCTFSGQYISKDRYMVKCNSCGWECEDLPGMTWGPSEYNYCPLCGRKVVEVIENEEE